MDRRSTNVKGFVHFGGDVRSGAEDGIGISLGSASTGSTAWIEAISDDTNANIGIRGQGAGGVTIGAGVGIKGAYSTTFAWTLAALSSGHQGEITLSSATWAVQASAPEPGDLIGFPELYPATATGDDLLVGQIRLSTVATSRVTIVVSNVASTATSTNSGTGRLTWFDLT